jgi:CubicO group peptidase (beta-lactamase class C family)
MADIVLYRNTMRLCTAYTILILTTLCGTAAADSVDDVVRARMQQDRIPGAVIAIEIDGEVDVRAYGVQSLESGAPMEPDAVFEYSSITKGLTGTALMTLVESGRVDLDESVTTYLTDAPESWSPITVRHSMTHSHGLPEILMVLAQVEVTGRITGEEQLQHLYEHDPLGVPGAQFFYTNTGPFLAGQIIERVTDETYNSFLRKAVFDPAGMKNATTVDDPPDAERVVETYTLRQDAHVPWSLTANVSMADDLAWCGVMGTAEDLVRFAQAFRSHELIQQDTVDDMLDGKLTTSTGSVVGAGWFVREYDRGRAIAHEGHTGTAFVAFLDQPITFVVLTTLTKGNQPPFGADKGHSSRSFLEAVMGARLEQTD